MKLHKRKAEFFLWFMEQEGSTITQAKKAWKAERQEMKRRRRTLTDQVMSICERRGNSSSPHRRKLERH